jgi:hypothetical protein
MGRLSATPWNAQAGILNFLQETIAMGPAKEELTAPAVTGLYYILQGTIDNTEHVMAFLDAAATARGERHA